MALNANPTITSPSPVSTIGSPSTPPAILPCEIAFADRGEVGRAGGAVDQRQPVDERRRADRPDHQVLEPRLERALAPGLGRAQDVQRDRQQLEADEQRDQVLGRDEHRHPEHAEQQQRVVLAVPGDSRGATARQRQQHGAIAATQNSMSRIERQVVDPQRAGDDRGRVVEARDLEPERDRQRRSPSGRHDPFAREARRATGRRAAPAARRRQARAAARTTASRCAGP